MLSNYLVAPSLNSLFVTGLLLISIVIIVVINFRKLLKHRLYEQIALLCMITIAFGSHGLVHLGVEKEYGFNPYKWF
jgi:hypothetical protein